MKIEQSAWNDYEGYKRIDKGDVIPMVNRPIRSLLHRYRNELDHSVFLEYMKLADECRTESEADLLAKAIIVMVCRGEGIMYYVVNKRSRRMGYIALAKATPFFNGQFEPKNVWFKIGQTEEKALTRLKESLPGNIWVKWEREENA